jgi:hypothetical protein
MVKKERSLLVRRARKTTLRFDWGLMGFREYGAEPWVRSRFQLREIGLDCIFMQSDIFTARLFSAGPAGQVIGGIDGLTVRAGIMFEHFVKPLGISDFANPLLGLPELDPVGALGLKFLQFLTGVPGTLPAELQAFLGGAARHVTEVPAIIASFFRTASPAFPGLLRLAGALGYNLKSLRLFAGADEYGAGRAKQPADGTQPFFVLKIQRPVHGILLLSWQGWFKAAYKNLAKNSIS